MSSTTFSQLEMLRIAILMEEEGKNFYSNGAKHTEGKVREFLTVAAGQEFIHKEKFTKLYNDLLEKNDEGQEYLFDVEVSAYLRALIENRVFDKKVQQEDAFKDLKSALEYAVKSEKLTVKIYTEMYKNTVNQEAKETLAALVNEEKAHVEYFSKLLNDIV